LILVVPTFSDASWSQSTTFEGVKYQLQFDFNQRCSSWYLSLADQDGVDIYNGVKLMCSRYLLRKCRDPRRPPGELLCLSSTNDTSPPTMLDLLPGSGRCTLVYATSDWVSTFQSGDVPAIVALFTQLQSGGTATSPVSSYGQPAA
jgi:hypothetical protein